MFSYTVNNATLDDFYDRAWSGGKNRLVSLKQHCMEVNDWDAWNYLEGYLEEASQCGEPLTETQVNDFLWFDSDDMLKEAGYLDEDYNWVTEDEEE